MSETPDDIGARLRAVAEEGRRDPLELTSAMVTTKGRREAGAPVARRHRIGLWRSSVHEAVSKLGQRPGRSARRVAALAFIAALVALASIGAVHVRTSGHGRPTATNVPGSSSSQPLGGGDTTVPSSTTTTVVGAATTTTVVGATTTTVVGATTTTIPPPQGIAGYQEVQQTVVVDCVADPSNPGCNHNGGVSTATATATCPSGTKVLGGGGTASDGQSDPTVAGAGQISASYPAADGSSWTVVGYGGSPTQALTIEVYATCADVAS